MFKKYGGHKENIEGGDGKHPPPHLFETKIA